MRRMKLFLLSLCFCMSLVGAAPSDLWIKMNVGVNKVKEENEKKAKEWLAQSQALLEEAEITNSPTKIELLKQSGHCLQQAVTCYGATLKKIETTGDKGYQDSLMKLWSHIQEQKIAVQKQIEHLLEKIAHLEKNGDSPLPKQTHYKPSAQSGYKFQPHPSVDITTGAFYADVTDFEVAGPIPIPVRRNYNSQHTLSGVFGHGWNLGLNPLLIEEKDLLYAAEPDGTVIAYRHQSASSKWLVLPEDNPELYQFHDKKPFQASIEKTSNGHILLKPDGSTRVFENFLLKKWTQPSGLFLLFHYEKRQLAKVESCKGSTLTFRYNTAGLIAEACSSDGRKTTYSYNPTNELIGVTLPNGSTIAYEYGAHHQLTRETQHYGQSVENIYDTKGRVVEQRSPVGLRQEVVTRASFSYYPRMTTVTDAAGATVEYRIFDNLIYQTTDPDGYSKYQSWFINDSSYFDAEKEYIVTSFDRTGGAVRALKSTLDKRGLAAEYRYDAKGNLIKKVISGADLTGNGTQKLTKTYQYNAHNLPVEEKVLNRTTKIFYNPNFPFIKKRIEQNVDHKTVSFVEYEYLDGQLFSENNNGAQIHWSYDERGFPKEKIEHTGSNDPEVITTFKYNAQGLCLEKKGVDGIERSTYDLVGNKTAQLLMALDGKIVSTTNFGYNLNGQMIWKKQESYPQNILYLDYNSDGCLKATRQSLTSVVGNTIEHAGFAYTLFDYDNRGHLTEEVDPLGTCIYREYNLMGQLSKESLDGATTQYIYEPGGLLSYCVSPSGETTARFYTTSGLLKNEIYPDGTESSYAYDLFGRPVLETKNGATWETIYDDVNIRQIRSQKETGIVEIRTYDSRGNLLSFKGEQTSYDLLNRVKTKTDPEGNTTSYRYNGPTITTVFPNGQQSTEKYAAGQLIEKDGVHYHYFPEQNMTEEVFEGAVKRTWKNSAGKPLIIQTDDLMTLFHYDQAGRLVKQQAGPFCLSFTYNKRHQITLAESSGKDYALIKRDYNDSGTLVSEEIALNGQRLHQIPDQNISLPIGEVEKDPWGNILSISSPSFTWKASYDAFGRRLQAVHTTKGWLWNTTTSL